MTRSFEAIKRKFYSPLANKQTILPRSSGETELTALNNGQTDNHGSVESAKISTFRSQSQAPINATTPVAGAQLGEHGTCKIPGPRSLSLGKRGNSCNLLPKAERQSKLQRSTYKKDPKLLVGFAGDTLQPTDADLKHPVTLPSSKEEPLLEIPLPANLRDTELSEFNLNDTSTYQTALGAVREIQEPPDQGLRLTTLKDSLHRLRSQLIPSACLVSHEDRTRVPGQPMYLILPLLQEFKSPDNHNRESNKEEHLSAEWSRVVSSEVPAREETAGCALLPREQSPLQSLYENQALEFHKIWSSKRLQMAEVAACMMQTDFQFLSIIQ